MTTHRTDRHRSEEVSMRYILADASNEKSYQEFFMAQGTNQDRFGGQYMIQDRDHLGEVGQETERASRPRTRQVEQSHSENRQQGDGNDAASRKGARRQQAH